MSEELEKLQKLGAQKIYEQTHIPVQNVQALLHSSFDSFSRVQFLGFISILEREYDLELVELKSLGLTHFNEEKINKKDDGLFVIPKKRKKNTLLYIVVVTLLFIIGLFLSLNSMNSEDISEHKPDNTLIENVQKSIEPKPRIETENIDLNNTVNQEIVVAVPKEKPVVVQSFKIITKSKVWFGYIDVGTNKKYQKTFSGEKDLDPKKSWLLLFGHGHIDMYINGEHVKFKNHENIRFFYEDGKLERITAREFRKLNRGSKW